MEIIKFNIVNRWAWDDLDRIARTKDKQIIVDLDELNYINSTMMAEFIKIIKEVKNDNKIVVVLCKYDSIVDKVFNIMSIRQAIPIFNFLDDAINYFTNN